MNSINLNRSLFDPSPTTTITTSFKRHREHDKTPDSCKKIKTQHDHDPIIIFSKTIDCTFKNTTVSFDPKKLNLDVIKILFDCKVLSENAVFQIHFKNKEIKYITSLEFNQFSKKVFFIEMNDSKEPSKNNIFALTFPKVFRNYSLNEERYEKQRLKETEVSKISLCAESVAQFLFIWHGVIVSNHIKSQYYNSSLDSKMDFYEDCRVHLQIKCPKNWTIETIFSSSSCRGGSNLYNQNGEKMFSFLV